MTTASASTPRFFTSACVMSRIMPTFCSSVRPAAMLMVISGISFSFCFLFATVHSRRKPRRTVYCLKSWMRGSSPRIANSVHPRHGMPCQYFAHGGHEIVFIDLRLRLGLFLQIFVTVLGRGETGAEDEILDLNLALRLFVRPLDDHARRVAAIGIFELVAHVLGIAEIELGADAGIAQLRDHSLIVGDAVTVEHGDDHGTGFRPRVELTQHRQRGLQARHADGKS